MRPKPQRLLAQCEVQRFASEVFHSLSQPLTAVICSLELALQRDLDSDRLVTSIDGALQNAHRLRERLFLAREMAEACDPGDLSQPVELQAVVHAVCEDLQPVFAASGHPLTWNCPESYVICNRTKLAQALYRLLESVRVRLPRESQLWVSARASKDGRRVRLQISARSYVDTLSQDLLFEVARRIFQSCGGELRVDRRGQRTIIKASLRSWQKNPSAGGHKTCAPRAKD